MDKKDVQYPSCEEVDTEEVFLTFKKLQIPGEVINVDLEKHDKGDDEDDDFHDLLPPFSLMQEETIRESSLTYLSFASPPYAQRQDKREMIDGGT